MKYSKSARQIRWDGKSFTVNTLDDIDIYKSVINMHFVGINIYPHEGQRGQSQVNNSWSQQLTINCKLFEHDSNINN